MALITPRNSKLGLSASFGRRGNGAGWAFPARRQRRSGYSLAATPTDRNDCGCRPNGRNSPGLCSPTRNWRGRHRSAGRSAVRSRAKERGVFGEVAGHLQKRPPVFSHAELDHVAAFSPGARSFCVASMEVFSYRGGLQGPDPRALFCDRPSRWAPPVTWQTVLRPPDDRPQSLTPGQVYQQYANGARIDSKPPCFKFKRNFLCRLVIFFRWLSPSISSAFLFVHEPVAASAALTATLVVLPRCLCASSQFLSLHRVNLVDGISRLQFHWKAPGGVAGGRHTPDPNLPRDV